MRQYGRSTLAVRAGYTAEGESFEADAHLDPLHYAAAGGAFLVRIVGTLVGVIGVSGLEMHGDPALVVEALRAHRELLVRNVGGAAG